jgi:hypothetical protein
MEKLAALAAVAAVALIPAAASAKPRAKVHKGTFRLVGADGSYTSDTFGKAQLVDGRRNDQLSVHVRKLGSRVKYVFRLQSSATACEAGAPAGTAVPGWHYHRSGLLVTSRKGVANSWARARGFTVKRDVEYYVGVFTRDASGKPDRLVACAQLTTKKTAAKGGGGKSHAKGGKPEDKGGKPEDKGGDHGKSGDKGGDHGKSGGGHGSGDGDHGQGRKARVTRR